MHGDRQSRIALDLSVLGMPSVVIRTTSSLSIPEVTRFNLTATCLPSDPSRSSADQTRFDEPPQVTPGSANTISQWIASIACPPKILLL